MEALTDFVVAPTGAVTGRLGERTQPFSNIL